MATSTSKTKTTKPEPVEKPASTAKTTGKMIEKPAPKPSVKVATKPASAPEAVVADPELKKKELTDLVVARSGIKKKDAKPVVEAMLAVLGETIASGRELNLQPLGKLRINRSTDKGNGNVIVCKLRQSKAAMEKARLPVDVTPAKV